tara:strand:+ start:440 stop:616 length:177 start_codon:yes stop_codon:yes gene_type:complete
MGETLIFIILFCAVFAAVYFIAYFIAGKRILGRGFSIFINAIVFSSHLGSSFPFLMLE